MDIISKCLYNLREFLKKATQNIFQDSFHSLLIFSTCAVSLHSDILCFLFSGLCILHLVCLLGYNSDPNNLALDAWLKVIKIKTLLSPYSITSLLILFAKYTFSICNFNTALT